MFKLGSGYSLSSWRVQFWSFPPGLISITKAANMNGINLSAQSQSQVLTQTFMFHSGEGIDPTGPMHHNISTSTKSVGKYRDLNFTTMGCSPDLQYMRESNKNRLFGTWLVPLNMFCFLHGTLYKTNGVFSVNSLGFESVAVAWWFDKMVCHMFATIFSWASVPSGFQPCQEFVCRFAIFSLHILRKCCD